MSTEIDGRAEFGDADTPLARWLRERIGRTHLKEIERQSKRRKVPVSATLLSNYLRGETEPTLRTVKRMAAFWNVPEAEIQAVIGVEAPEAGLPGAAHRIAREAAEYALRAYTSWQRGGEQPMAIGSAGPGAPANPVPIRSIAGSFRHGLQPVEVVGDCLEPRLRPGWIAWVNPEVTARPGDIVLALVDGDEMFKILNRAGDMAFLEALDGRPAIPVGPNVTIQGVVQLVQHSP